MLSLTIRVSSCVNAHMMLRCVLEVKETKYLRIPCCSPLFRVVVDARAVTIAITAQKLGFSEFEFCVRTNNLARARWGGGGGGLTYQRPILSIIRSEKQREKFDFTLISTFYFTCFSTYPRDCFSYAV